MLNKKNLIAASIVSCCAISSPAWANSTEIDWSGFYAGVEAGNRHIDASGISCAADPNNPIGGTRGCDKAGSESWNGTAGNFHIGYNWETASHLVAGIEASINYADNDHSHDGFSQYGISHNTNKQNFSADVKARLGYAFDKLLVYGAGGTTWMKVDTTKTQGACGDGNNPPNYSDANCSTGPYTGVPLGTLNKSSDSRIGWTLGGGAELALTKSISLRAEYVHADYGTFKFLYPSFNRVNTTKVKSDDVMAGLNYKF